MERSLKEAASELEARLKSDAHHRRFPVMGLRGAANALMLREAALRLQRPIFAVTSLTAEAEALASELAFFLGESADADVPSRRVHLLRGWELKPFAAISPPADVQASQLAALFAMRRMEAPVIVTSAEALMMRTVPREDFDASIVKIAAAESLDLELLIDTLSAMGFQRVPQCEEAGDFSVRGGIVDVFSPLYQNPVRIELEDDIVTSIRHFEAATQRSLGDVSEATIIPTRYVAPGALKSKHVLDEVALRAAEIGMVRKEAAELEETLETGLLFPGAEMLMPYVYQHPLDSIFAYVPDNAVGWLVDPGRIVAEAYRRTDAINAEASTAQAKPAFFPQPGALYLTCEEVEQRLGQMTAVEIGALVTAIAPREGWAPPIEVTSSSALKLSSVQLTGQRNAISFEPLATELKTVQHAQSHAVMIIEGANQIARLRRHLEAYDIEVNTDSKSFPELLDRTDYRPAIIEGAISSGVVLQADGLFLYSEEEIFGEPHPRRRTKPRRGGVALLNLEELHPGDHVVHVEHGIGQYRGLKHMKVSDVEGDFLNLEYAENGTMYIPVERINQVHRYVGGADNEQPKLDKLGSGAWEKVKRRTKAQVLAMASELLDIYAAREVMEGHAFPHPGRDYTEFSDRFEFE
ncbi:MAG TPA: CarD family transcriptional regulator, partial [Candidatus Binataceae bacterium]|nr:CarD family transcriptional regulator [Candidatus Binataceae bacterium]